MHKTTNTLKHVHYHIVKLEQLITEKYRPDPSIEPRASCLKLISSIPKKNCAFCMKTSHFMNK